MEAQTATRSAANSTTLKRKWTVDHDQALMAARTRNHFENVTVNDQAHVQLGDTYHIHTRSSESNDPERSQYDLLYNSLAFSRMDARLHNVASAIPETCQWLRADNEFVKWATSNSDTRRSRLLWIKGKPGSGKSTIMKETFEWVQQNWSFEINLSYFFNARSQNELEKSSIGLYRSLIYQLLSAKVIAGAKLAAKFATKIHDGVVDPWTRTELQNFLLQIIPDIERPLNIFIDALDEGTEDDVRQMINFLDRMRQQATKANVALRICLASRHYPSISISQCSRVILEKQAGHAQDIQRYVSEQLTGADDPQMEDVRSSLCIQARGIFLWTVLVVQLLNRAYDSGFSATAIYHKLRAIPAEVGDVFTQILLRDETNLDKCFDALAWTMFSFRPMTLEELYGAVNRDWNEFRKPESLPSLIGMERWLVTTARGLLDLTRQNPPTVQVIHETLRTFLLDFDVKFKIKTRAVDPDIFDCNRYHMHFARTSLECLTSTKSGFFNEELMLKQCPFRQYASEYWCIHARSSAYSCDAKMMENATLLLRGASPDTFRWLRRTTCSEPVNAYDPWLTRLLDMLCSWRASSVDTRLILASTTGIPALVELMVGCGLHDIQEGEEGCALQVAAGFGFEHIVRILLDAENYINKSHTYQQAVLLALDGGQQNVARTMLEVGLPFLGTAQIGNLLSVAIKKSQELTFVMLIEADVDINVSGVEK